MVRPRGATTQTYQDFKTGHAYFAVLYGLWLWLRLWLARGSFAGVAAAAAFAYFFVQTEIQKERVSRKNRSNYRPLYMLPMFRDGGGDPAASSSSTLFACWCFA